MNNQEYNRFLKKLYDILYKNSVINKVPSTHREKIAIVSDYFEKLERVSNKAAQSHFLPLLKKMYYDKYIIKEENVPKSYWRKLEQNYLENGHGHLNLIEPKTTTEKKLKYEHYMILQKEQTESLDLWLNYFLSSDSDYLPTWAKVWAFQGMLNIGTLNENKDGYYKRRSDTVAPYVSMDAEILGKSVELLKEHLSRDKSIPLKEDYETILANTENFTHIYGSLLAKKKKLTIHSNEGIWVKYPKGSDELKLYNDLQGYNTGWCTAATTSIARSQLQEGDFYVYYTKNEQYEYKIPRLAIRLNDIELEEVRGIGPSQEVEPELVTILEDKLEEFPDKDKYLKKTNDMKMLTLIYNENKRRKLTKEELIFLYEVNTSITGFGYGKDPRIAEIINSRNIRADLSCIFGYKEEEIALTPDEYEGRFFYGNINIEREDNEVIVLPKIVYGAVSLNLNNLKDVVWPEKINGDLRIYCNSTIIENNVTLPEVTENIFIKHVTKIEGSLNFSDSNSVIIEDLESDENLHLLSSLKHLSLPNLKKANFSYLPPSLKFLRLDSLTQITNLVLPASLENLELDSLTQITNFKLPSSLKSLSLSNLKSDELLDLPPSLEHLRLDSLTQITNLKLPSGLKYLSLNSLQRAKGLKIPTGLKTLYLKNMAFENLLEFEFPEEFNLNFLSVKEHVYSAQNLKEYIAHKRALSRSGYEGIWIKFDEKSEPEKLNNLLNQNKMLPTICEYPYLMYDYHVYCTKKDGEYTLPRLIINSRKNEICNIFNEEKELAPILANKLQEFGNSKEWLKKLNDFITIEKLYDEYQERSLTKEEIRFIYDIGFQEEKGLNKNSIWKSKEILSSRDKVEDLSQILGCEKSQIGFTPESYEGKVYYEGNINVTIKNRSKRHVLPKIVYGNVYIECNEHTNLVLPEKVVGDFIINGHYLQNCSLPAVSKSFKFISPIKLEDVIFYDEYNDIDLSYVTEMIRTKLPNSMEILRLPYLNQAPGVKIPGYLKELYVPSMELVSLLEMDFSESKSLERITTIDGSYNYENLKPLIIARKEEKNQEDFSKESFRRGNINILFILLPSAIILIGIVFSYLVTYK